MYYFCTYFNRHYLVRGLALYRSLKDQSKPFKLWVLCFDDFTFDALSRLNLSDLIPIALEDFERGDEALREAKQNRSLVEYFFTCSPSWPRYLLNQFPEIDIVTYLDADLFFYSSPEAIYNELGDQSILIVGHRFPERLRHLEKYGIFNVGLLTIRNDAYGWECLEWWRERCLEWCYDKLEDGRFADQKYLDDWPTRFKQVVVSEDKGTGLAPWNWMNYRIQLQDGRWNVDGQPLVFYHFHALKIINRWLYDPVSSGRMYGEMPLKLRWRLYQPYMHMLKKAECWVKTVEPNAELHSTEGRSRGYGWKGMLLKALRAQLMLHYTPK